MLLRSLTKHVRDQNWFAVALDFFIVVAGILIAFQITNWNEARADRATEREYLERLSSDLSRTIEKNEILLERNSHSFKDLDATLSALDACEISPGSEAAFASGLFFLGRYTMPEFVSGSFEELNATGNFLLIRDLELRDRITDVYELIERTYLIDRQLNDRVVPKVNYVRKFARFNTTKAIARGEGLIDAKILDIDFEAVCRDLEFKNSVSAVREVMITVRGFARGTINRSKELKSHIDKALGRPTPDVEDE